MVVKIGIRVLDNGFLLKKTDNSEAAFTYPPDKDEIEGEKAAFTELCYALRDELGSLDIQYMKYKEGNLSINWDKKGHGL